MGQADKKAAKGARDLTSKIYQVIVNGASESGHSGLFGTPQMHVGTVSGNVKEVTQQTEKTLAKTAEELGGNILVKRDKDGNVSIVEGVNRYRSRGQEGTITPTAQAEDLLDPVALQRFKSGTGDAPHDKKWVKAKEREGVEYLPPTPKEVMEQGQGGAVTIKEIAKRSGWNDSINRWLEQPERSTLVRVLGGAYGDLDPQKQASLGTRLAKSFLTIPSATLGTYLLAKKTPEEEAKAYEEEVKKEVMANKGKQAVANSMEHGDWSSQDMLHKSRSVLEDFKLDPDTFDQAVASVYYNAGKPEDFFSMGSDAMLESIKREYVSKFPENEKLAKVAKRNINKGAINAYLDKVRKGEAMFVFPTDITSEEQEDKSWRVGRTSPDDKTKRYYPVIVASGEEIETKLGAPPKIGNKTRLVWIDTSKKGLEGYTEENMALSKINREANKQK